VSPCLSGARHERFSNGRETPEAGVLGVGLGVTGLNEVPISKLGKPAPASVSLDGRDMDPLLTLPGATIETGKGIEIGLGKSSLVYPNDVPAVFASLLAHAHFLFLPLITSLLNV